MRKKHFPSQEKKPRSAVFYLQVFILQCFFVGQALGDAEFKINYKDSINEGFYEQTSANPVGGNTGTTLGEQRRNAFEYAISILAKALESNVTIEVDADFSEMGGTDSSATLAFAGPYSLNWNFQGAPQQNLYYPIALANKFANKDLDPNGPDINSSFNSSIDNNTVLGSSHWYYGLDLNGNLNDIDFVTVALHELLHGLGFLSLFDVSTGKKYECENYPECQFGMDDIFSLYLERANASPSALLEMSDGQRQLAATADGNIRWTGDKTSRILTDWTDTGISANKVLIYAPFPSSPGSTLSHFDVSLSPDSLMEPNYTIANHEMGLAAAVLADIGWGNLADINLTFTSVSNNNNQTTTSLILENYGPDNAPSHRVEITAANTNFSSPATTNNGSCTTSSRLVSCRMNSLNSGDTANINITAEEDTDSLFTASVETAHVEVNIADNEVSLNLNESDNSVNSSVNPTHINTAGSGGGSYSFLSLFTLLTIMLLRSSTRIQYSFHPQENPDK